MNSCPAISALVWPAHDQVEHLVLAAGQAQRVGPGRGARARRDRPEAEGAHPLPGRSGRRRRTQVGQDRQRLAQRLLVAATSRASAASYGQPRSCHRRAAAFAGRPSSSALVGLGDGRARGRAIRAGAPQPDRRRRRGPTRRVRGRHVVCQPGLAARRRPAVPRASAPRRGPAGRHDVLRLAGPVGVAHRLVEVVPGAWLAPPGPDQAEQAERVEPVDRGARSPRLSSSRLSGLAHSAQRPVRSRAVIRSLRRQRRVGADVVVVAVGDALREVPLGFGELPLTAKDSLDVRERPAGLTLAARRHGDAQRPVEQLAGPVPAQARRRRSPRC